MAARDYSTWTYFVSVGLKVWRRPSPSDTRHGPRETARTSTSIRAVRSLGLQALPRRLKGEWEWWEHHVTTPWSQRYPPPCQATFESSPIKSNPPPLDVTHPICAARDVIGRGYPRLDPSWVPLDPPWVPFDPPRVPAPLSSPCASPPARHSASSTSLPQVQHAAPSPLQPLPLTSSCIPRSASRTSGRYTRPRGRAHPFSAGL